MDRKQQPILHELLQQEQEPFHLKTYINDRRSSLSHSSPAAAPQGGFLHVPPLTAAFLAEAAARIQKQQIKKAGLGSLFGSFLKLLKHGSSSKVIGDRDLKERENWEGIRISCSCRGLIRDESADFEERLRSSSIIPCRFSPQKFSGRRRSPDLRSPAASPIRRAKQDKENCVISSEEEKEQCSPVSVLDTFFDDDEHESQVGEEDDHDLERSYANIERARKQLLERLERFEKLAALDQVDLEQKLLEASEGLIEGEELPRGEKQGSDDTDTSSWMKQQSPMKMSATYMKRLIGEDEGKIVMMGRRSCGKWHLAREADVTAELEEWGRWWSEEAVEESAAEVEAAIFGGLIEECFNLHAWI